MIRHQHPRPPTFIFAGETRDYGHMYLWGLMVEIGGYHVWSTAVPFYIGGHPELLPQSAVDDASEMMVRKFWRRLGAM